MADIKRTKPRNVGPSMGSPLDVADQAARKAHADEQASIEALWRRVEQFEASLTTDATPYDDAWLKREIRRIDAELRGLDGRVTALEQKFPIFRHCRVKGEQADYLECVFWNPASEVEGAAVNVAKPFELRVTPFDGETIDLGGGNTYTYAYISWLERTRTDQDAAETTEAFNPPYFLNDVILVAKTNPAVLDLGGNIIIWQDLNTAGRSWNADTFQWNEADSFSEFPEEVTDGSWWRAPNIFPGDGIPVKAVAHVDHYVSITNLV